MSMFDKIKARNREAFEPLLSENFIGRSIANNNEYTRDNVLEYCDTFKVESYELIFETETKIVCQAIDVTEEGRRPVMDVWTHDGSKIIACDFLFGQMDEE
ncbi:hypothetical protein N9X46_08540 [Paracoccaceae bacterium]|jgi:hypothetical protein|nr:hypothetical protein [Paracoccaceae bacterium]MDB3948941.1 hypothetical protein [Paracoccaceae bacterium]